MYLTQWATGIASIFDRVRSSTYMYHVRGCCHTVGVKTMWRLWSECVAVLSKICLKALNSRWTDLYGRHLTANLETNVATVDGQWGAVEQLYVGDDWTTFLFPWCIIVSHRIDWWSQSKSYKRSTICHCNISTYRSLSIMHVACVPHAWLERSTGWNVAMTGGVPFMIYFDFINQ